MLRRAQTQKAVFIAVREGSNRRQFTVYIDAAGIAVDLNFDSIPFLPQLVKLAILILAD